MGRYYILKSALVILLAALTMVGCATNDYDLDLDALLAQLELEAGVDYPATPASISPEPYSPPTSSYSAPQVVKAPPVTVVTAPPPTVVTGQTVASPQSAPVPATPAAPVPATPAPTAAAPAAPAVEPTPPEPPPPGEITIQPDCLVQISVEEDPALNGSYPVNEIGAVKLGYVGPVILYNKTEAQAAEKIRDILTSRHFRNATVQVRIIRASYDKVRVGGEVVNPGVIKIGAGDVISLNDALLRVGGLNPTARGAKVKLVRNGLRKATALAEEGEVYSLADAAGNPAVPDISLRNNDVAYVFIPAAGGGDVPLGDGEEQSVVVLGEVRQPGVYTFRPGEPCTMMHLMFRVAGQMTPYAKQDGVLVIRKNEKGWDEEIRVDVERLMEDGDPDADIPLQDGDRVVVPKRRITLF